MTAGEREATDELAYLRQESLRTVTIYLIGGLYLWCAVLFVTHDRFGSWWWSPSALAGGLGLAFALWRHNLSLAGAAVIMGLAVAELCGVWRGDLRMAPDMLAVAVGLTGVLFGLKAVVGMTALCIGSVIAIGSLRWGRSPFSPELGSSILVIGAVGVLSSLAVRSLYQALYWFQERAAAAQRNEREARRHRAELAQTLKTLDQAYYRLEYLNYDLERAREAAEKARRGKKQFVAHVSHELRTPLNVILAFSETMYLSPDSYDGVPLPVEYRGDVREMYRSSRHLLHLVNDVLDMSQIEAGHMRVDRESVKLRRMVTEALDMIRPLVDEEAIALRAEVPSDLPPVFVDRSRVQQVLLNLLNNARRFTEHGSIGVKAVEKDGKLRVTVHDTGIGIPPGEQQEVFKEFHQLEVSRRQESGTGLGLAISKRLIEMHGGRIWIESEGVPGRGARFHFTLPVTGGEQRQIPFSQEGGRSLEPSRGRGRTLLLLDGHASLAQLVERGLKEYTVVPVDDISEVPRLIEELHARAVLLSPTQNDRTEQRLQALHQELADLSIPIIVCPLVGERQLARSLDVTDYLVKPITRERLVATLDALEDSVHWILVVDDDPRMARVLSRMLEADGREVDVTRAYGGRQGLREMRRRRPDLVLLDLVMPEVDGYDVLARMEEEPALRHIPVAVITARARTYDEERRLGGNKLCVSIGAGLTNEEILRYLGGILDVVETAPL